MGVTQFCRYTGVPQEEPAVGAVLWRGRKGSPASRAGVSSSPQEEEAASQPHFCHQSVRQSPDAPTWGWGKAERERLAAEMAEEAPSGPVDQTLFVFLRLSHCRVPCPCLRTFPCSRAALGQSPGSQPASPSSAPHKRAADKKDSCVHLGKKRGSTTASGSIAQLRLHGNEMSRLLQSPCCVLSAVLGPSCSLERRQGSWNDAPPGRSGSISAKLGVCEKVKNTQRRR